MRRVYEYQYDNRASIYLYSCIASQRGRDEASPTQLSPSCSLAYSSKSAQEPSCSRIIQSQKFKAWFEMAPTIKTQNETAQSSSSQSPRLKSRSFIDSLAIAHQRSKACSYLTDLHYAMSRMCISCRIAHDIFVRLTNR